MKLYFMGTTIGGFVKVGISRDPQKRLAVLTSSGPFELDLLAVFDGPDERAVIRAEAEIHSALRAHRARGEWYLASEPIARLARFAQEAKRLRDVVDEAKRIGEGHKGHGGQLAIGMLTYCAHCGSGKPLLGDLHGSVAVLEARQH